MELYAVNVTDEMDKELIDKLLLYVDSDKKERVHKCRNLWDKQRILLGDVLIRSIICSKLQISNSEIVFEYNSYGKPHLKGSSGFHFNIAHSGDWVIAGVDTVPLGIDVEQICKNEFMDIAERFFADREYRWLLDRQDSEKLNSFYILWTLKESYVKMLGKGLSLPLNSFSIVPDINGTASVIDINNNTANAYLYYMKIDHKHYIAVCSEREHERVNVNVVSCKDKSFLPGLYSSKLTDRQRCTSSIT